MEFVKMHGTGNDFIIVEDFNNDITREESILAINICHRRFGVGADGLVIIRNSKVADVKMEIINSDGSKANMCGNAIRCFSKYVFEHGIINKRILNVETGDGVKEVELFIDENNLVDSVRVCMGVANFSGDIIPLNGKKSLINEYIVANNKEFNVTSLLVGVPHTIVLYEDENYDIKDGSFIEKHPMFKNGTNVNFVKVIDKQSIKVSTWERGAGATYSCGTGCSAAVAVTSKLMLTGKNVTVIVEGGKLKIEIINNNIFMSGRAEFICRGIFY